MTIPLTTMTPEERERLCYVEGFTESAALFARIDELETAAEALLEALDDHYAKNRTLPRLAIQQAVDKLREVLDQ